tara:strand:- start:6824 stop:7129 length:306 start_codon:yes stop_codon:yes gene_type:complete
MESILQDSLTLNTLYRKNKKPVDIFNDDMKTVHSALYEAHPTIFKIAISTSYDYDRLKYMLEMADKIKKKTITEHDASVKVGEVLVNDLVKPQLSSDKECF